MAKIGKLSTSPNFTVIIVANAAFLLGLVCFIVPFLTHGIYFKLALMVLMYVFFLINALLGAKLQYAGGWKIFKSPIAGLCCYQTTAYLVWTIDIYAGAYEFTENAGNTISLILHVVTAFIMLLPIVGFVRRIQAIKKGRIGPKKARFSPKTKIAFATMSAAVTGVIIVLGFVNIVSLFTQEPLITVDYVARYNAISKPLNYDLNENAVPYYEKAFAAHKEIPDGLDRYYGDWPGDLNEADQATLQSWLANNNESLSYLRQAAKKPYFWKELKSPDGSLNAAPATLELSRYRHAIYYLKFWAETAANENRTKEALETTLDMYKLSLHLFGSKMLIEQLV